MPALTPYIGGPLAGPGPGPAFSFVPGSPGPDVGWSDPHPPAPKGQHNPLDELNNPSSVNIIDEVVENPFALFEEMVSKIQHEVGLVNSRFRGTLEGNGIPESGLRVYVTFTLSGPDSDNLDELKVAGEESESEAGFSSGEEDEKEGNLYSVAFPLLSKSPSLDDHEEEQEGQVFVSLLRESTGTSTSGRRIRRRRNAPGDPHQQTGPPPPYENPNPAPVPISNSLLIDQLINDAGNITQITADVDAEYRAQYDGYVGAVPDIVKQDWEDKDRKNKEDKDKDKDKDKKGGGDGVYQYQYLFPRLWLNVEFREGYLDLVSEFVSETMLLGYGSLEGEEEEVLLWKRENRVVGGDDENLNHTPTPTPTTTSTTRRGRNKNLKTTTSPSDRSPWWSWPEDLDYVAAFNGDYIVGWEKDETTGEEERVIVVLYPGWEVPRASKWEIWEVIGLLEENRFLGRETRFVAQSFEEGYERAERFRGRWARRARIREELGRAIKRVREWELEGQDRRGIREHEGREEEERRKEYEYERVYGKGKIRGKNYEYSEEVGILEKEREEAAAAKAEAEAEELKKLENEKEEEKEKEVEVEQTGQVEETKTEQAYSEEQAKDTVKTEEVYAEEQAKDTKTEEAYAKDTKQEEAYAEERAKDTKTEEAYAKDTKQEEAYSENRKQEGTYAENRKPEGACKNKTKQEKAYAEDTKPEKALASPSVVAPLESPQPEPTAETTAQPVATELSTLS